jgi:hypothetical protein
VQLHTGTIMAKRPHLLVEARNIVIGEQGKRSLKHLLNTFEIEFFQILSILMLSN